MQRGKTDPVDMFEMPDLVSKKYTINLPTRTLTGRRIPDVSGSEKIMISFGPVTLVTLEEATAVLNLLHMRHTVMIWFENDKGVEVELRPYPGGHAVTPRMLVRKFREMIVVCTGAVVHESSLGDNTHARKLHNELSMVLVVVVLAVALVCYVCFVPKTP